MADIWLAASKSKHYCLVCLSALSQLLQTGSTFKVNKYIKCWYFLALWCHNEIHQPATSLAWCAHTQANAQCSHVDGLSTSIFSWFASKLHVQNIFIQWYWISKTLNSKASLDRRVTIYKKQPTLGDNITSNHIPLN